MGARVDDRVGARVAEYGDAPVCAYVGLRMGSCALEGESVCVRVREQVCAREDERVCVRVCVRICVRVWLSVYACMRACVCVRKADTCMYTSLCIAPHPHFIIPPLS